jgi:hypothetical protein
MKLFKEILYLNSDITERLAWAARLETTVEEDAA